MYSKMLGGLARKIGFRKKASWCLRKINYTRRICINDVGIRIPSIHGIACKESEPWMIDLLAALLHQRSGAFLDVGVNVGQTLIKVKAIDSDRGIHWPRAQSRLRFLCPASHQGECFR